MSEYEDQRNELARRLYIADNWKRREAPEDWATERHDHKQAYFHMADAVWAAGYRKAGATS